MTFKIKRTDHFEVIRCFQLIISLSLICFLAKPTLSPWMKTYSNTNDKTSPFLFIPHYYNLIKPPATSATNNEPIKSRSLSLFRLPSNSAALLTYYVPLIIFILFGRGRDAIVRYRGPISTLFYYCGVEQKDSFNILMCSEWYNGALCNLVSERFREWKQWVLAIGKACQ